MRVVKELQLQLLLKNFLPSVLQLKAAPRTCSWLTTLVAFSDTPHTCLHFTLNLIRVHLLAATIKMLALLIALISLSQALTRGSCWFHVICSPCCLRGSWPLGGCRSCRSRWRLSGCRSHSRSGSFSYNALFKPNICRV